MHLRRLAQALLALTVFVCVTTFVAFATEVLRLGGDVLGQLARVTTLASETLPLATEVFDAHGEKIGEFAGERRYYVPLASLPPHLVQAFLSAEDKDFYHHIGVNFRAIARSAVADLRGGSLRQGASTITQQLARAAFLDQRKTWERKVKEALLALAIERKLSKAQILELYLNRIYLGNHSYGVEAAARNYFRKHAADLDVGEAALLAGLPQSPSRYAPHRHAARATARQRLVLGRMAADGKLSERDAKSWSKREVAVAAGPESFAGRAPYFLAAVQQELGRMFESETLPLEGLRIYTTLDSGLQRAAAAQLGAALGRDFPAAPRRRAEVEGALVSLDPRTGAVLAMQGGRAFGRTQFNRAEATRRPLAALFLPVEVGLALERGFSLASRIGDDPVSGRRLGPQAGVPTLYQAVLGGLILEAAPLYTALGSGSMLEQAGRLGLRLGREDLGVAFGYGEATPTEVAVAYAAFVNGGRTVTPYLVSRVETAGGRRLFAAAPAEGRAAMSPQTAYIMAQVLADMARYGQGHVAGTVSPFAGAMGATTDDLHDAWFVGTLPTVVSAVWIGAETGVARLAASEAAAAQIPLRIWNAFMRAAPPSYLQARPSLAPPPGVSFARRPDAGDGARSIPVLSKTEPPAERRTF